MNGVENLSTENGPTQEAVEKRTPETSSEDTENRAKAEKMLEEVNGDMRSVDQALEALREDAWMVEATLRDREDFERETQALMNKKQQLEAQLAQLQAELTHTETDDSTVEQIEQTVTGVDGYTKQYEKLLESGELSAADLADQISQPFDVSEEFLAAREQFHTEANALEARYHEDTADLRERAKTGKFDPTNEQQTLEKTFRATYDLIKNRFQPVRDRERAQHAEAVGRYEATNYSLDRTLAGKSQLFPENISLAVTATQETSAQDDPKIDKVVRVPDSLLKLTETI